MKAMLILTVLAVALAGAALAPTVAANGHHCQFGCTPAEAVFCLVKEGFAECFVHYPPPP